MEISLPLLESALRTLYSDPNPQNKHSAQKWLIKAQKDLSAWNWSFQLLGDGNSFEVQYFGASVIHYKITNCWDELPKDKIDDLRYEIFQLIFRFSNGPKVVLTRSCTALAAIVLHRVADTWPNAISDIVQNFRTVSYPDLSMENRCNALLEVLTVIPEEYQTCRLDKAQKRCVRNGIKNGSSCVLQLILELIHSGQISIIAKAIKSLAAWLALELPLNEITEHIELCFQTIKNPKYFDVSVDALMNALYSPSSHQYANTLGNFFPRILELETLLDAAIQNPDQESLLGISRVICGLGENHCRLVLSRIDRGGINIIELILKITKLPLQYPTEENCSPVSFSFWYSLQDEFESMSYELRQNWGRFVHALFYQLIEGLIGKLKLPNLKLFTSDEKESYRIYRIDISDTLMYIYNLLNQSMLQFMADAVCQIMSHDSYDWRDVESILFCFYSIVEACEPDGDFIQKVAEILPRLDMSNEYLADTVIYTVGSLSEWLVNNPKFINKLLPIVIPGLQKPELALTSVLTLKRITRECRFQLSNSISLELIEVMRTSLHTEKLQAQEQLWLIQSIGHVLSAIEENECLFQLNKTISRYIKRLKTNTEKIVSLDNSTKTILIHDVNLLSHMVSTLDRASPDITGEIRVVNQRPACLIIQQMTTIFQQLLKKIGPDCDVLNAVCHFYDKSVRTVVDHGVSIMPEMSHLLSEIISQAPISSAVDVVQQIISMFWKEKPNECFMLLRAVTKTVGHLKESGGLSHNPDIVTSSMELYAFLMRKMSDFLLVITEQDTSILNHMAEVARSALNFPEQPVVKSAVSFITEATRQSNPNVQKMIEKFGQDFLFTLLKGITGCAGRTLLDYIGDGLFFLSKPNVQLFALWLNNWLAERRKLQNTKESDAQRSNFVQQLLRERSNKRTYREVCSQFALMARGLHAIG